MEYVKLPWQMGHISHIFNKAVKVAAAAECPCSFEFNGVEIFVDEESIYNEHHAERIQRAVNSNKKELNCYGE